MNTKNKKKAFSAIIFMVIVCVLAFGLFKLTFHVLSIFKDLEIAKTKALEKATEETNSKCYVVTAKYCGDYYQIGCTNEKDNHAILYIVKPSIDKEFWLVSELASRTGADSSDMFHSPVYITQ